MTFHMDVKVEKVLEDGTYAATLESVEKIDYTDYGERLIWRFAISEHDTEVVSFTSTSPSTKAHAYQWATAIMGRIDPKLGWGPEAVEGKRCRVVLVTVEDKQGIEKNKVVKVMPPKEEVARPGSDRSSDGDNFDEIPF